MRWLAVLDRFDLTEARCLQQDEALARGLLRILITLPFVFDLQAPPFIRIDGLEVGSLELAIGVGLRRQQRRVWPPDVWLDVSYRFRRTAGAWDGANGRRFAFVQGRTEFALRRIARAAGKRQRTKDDADGQKSRNKRSRAGGKRSPACFTIIPGKVRRANDGHANDSDLTRALVRDVIDMRMSMRQQA